MQIELICSKQIEAILIELLTSRGISIDKNAQVCIVEKGLAIPDMKVGILFDMTNLNVLMELVSHLVGPSEGNNQTIVGKSEEERYELITYPIICCFEGRGNAVFCITTTGEYRIKEKLYELEGKLPRSQFIRVSKSYIVNIGNVKEIIPWFGGRLILRFTRGNKEVEVSRSQVKSFKEFLGM